LLINGDKGRLRQLLHNLVKNAIEAMRDGHGSTLWVSSRREHVAGADCIELSVRDNGPGFPNHILASALSLM
jgi:C4-dicarboxylate-specific signal transduction histidine kinase